MTQLVLLTIIAGGMISGCEPRGPGPKPPEPKTNVAQVAATSPSLPHSLQVSISR